jgi:hypothetical protein
MKRGERYALHLKQTRRRVLRAIRRISFEADPFSTTLSLDRKSKLWVGLSVICRDTGEPVTIRFGNELPLLFLSDEEVVDWIYMRVRAAWVHELNEALFVDGARRRDLHDERGNTIDPPEDRLLRDVQYVGIRLATLLRDAKELSERIQ